MKNAGTDSLVYFYILLYQLSIIFYHFAIKNLTYMKSTSFIQSFVFTTDIFAEGLGQWTSWRNLILSFVKNCCSGRLISLYKNCKQILVVHRYRRSFFIIKQKSNEEAMFNGNQSVLDLFLSFLLFANWCWSDNPVGGAVVQTRCLMSK